MGSHNQWLVSINATGDKLKEIVECGRAFEKATESNVEEYWDDFCLNKWSCETKWNPYDILGEMSKKYPDVIFSVSFRGDYGAGKNFILNNKEIQESKVLRIPAFPTLTAMKRALKIEEYNTKKREELLLKKKEEEAKVARLSEIKKLEERLNVLKAGT